MKKVKLLLLLALFMSCSKHICSEQMMRAPFEDDLTKFDDRLNRCEVEFARAIYHNDVQRAAAIANSASKREDIDINKYVNAQRWNKKGSFTFLLLATVEDRPDIVKLILEDNTWGRDIINQQSRSSKRTALHVAAERGFVGITKILLDRGADVHAKTTAGETPLHLAAERNYVRVAEKLLEKEANVHVETRAGKTPLHLAAENNCKEAVLYLLDKQANPQATDHQGKTPLALAQSANHEEIVQILKRFEKKSRRRSCIDCAAACDQHFTGCPTISVLGFTLDCACFQKPCSFTCKSLCCIWCHPLKEEAPHSTPSSSTAAPTPIEQPVPSEATMER